MRNYTIKATTPDERLGEALTRVTKLKGDLIARMLECGAVQIRFRAKGPWERVRDPRIKLDKTDVIKACLDERVLSIPAFTDVQVIAENKNYGVYVKPAGVMAQGTDAGDHCTLLYAVNKLGKQSFPVHRLDRETEGLMLVAFNSQAAAKLSQLFQLQKVHKTYLAIVAGETSYLGVGTQGSINEPLDRKSAETQYNVLQELEDSRLLVELKPLTGRLHQIRRHLELIDCGVWGDPKYGKRNKNREGMKLAATELRFVDPWSLDEIVYRYKASFSPKA
ncbi:MAG: RluA family pseudouridine synthase [Bacteriovoracaceae bacterium]|nr:RluA family pseudouridine synthase [Bacteriovoracaceae bacterium]